MMTVGLIISCLPGMPTALTGVEINMVVIWFLLGGLLAAFRWYEVRSKNAKKARLNMSEATPVGK